MLVLVIPKGLLLLRFKRVKLNRVYDYHKVNRFGNINMLILKYILFNSPPVSLYDNFATYKTTFRTY